jgi:hypothetical protein
MSRERDEMRKNAPIPLSDGLREFWPPPDPREVLAGNSPVAVAAREKVGSCFNWQHDGWSEWAIERAFEIANELAHGITVRAAAQKAEAFLKVEKWPQIVEVKIKLRLPEVHNRTEGLLRLYGDRLVRALMDSGAYPIVGGNALGAETMRHWDIEVDFVHEWPDFYFRGIAIKRDLPPMAQGPTEAGQ